MAVDELIRTAVERPLDLEEAERVFDHVMQGRASEVQKAALLVALSVRGPVSDEVAGGVRALRRAMVPVAAPADRIVVDTCGTGGGAITTFNISTAAALLASALGVSVAKHGNRSFTSRCGSADVLQSLGVSLEVAPERLAEILDQIGLVFMFAPNHHPAMRHVAAVRKELGMFTIMNLLGPLSNPAGVRRQVVGVVQPQLVDLVAGALDSLGHHHAMVVHGEPGMDELSPLGVSRVVEVRDGAIRGYDFDPRKELGWPQYSAADLLGGEPEQNVRIVEDVLRGRVAGAKRAAVALNAAAALVVGGVVESLPEGVALAERGLDEGAGWVQLERLRHATAPSADNQIVNTA